MAVRPGDAGGRRRRRVALYGNRIDGVDTGEQDELALENLVCAVRAAAAIDGQGPDRAGRRGRALPAADPADALAVADRVNAASGLANCTLLPDLYHLAVNGDEVAGVIGGHAARIGHVQIADAPGRGEPGSGKLSIEPWLAELAAAGYDGWVGLEYKPAGASADSFAWLRPDGGRA